MLICPEGGHEWTGAAPARAGEIRDFVGNPLTDGDQRPEGERVIPCRERAARVSSIRLPDGDHDIDCKIDGIGVTGLKSEFVKKVWPHQSAVCLHLQFALSD